MTITQADGFFAFDVSTYLFIAIIVTFFVVVFDKLFFNKNNQNLKTDENLNKNTKKGLKKWIYFFLFLKFEKNQNYIHRPKIVVWSAEFFPVLLLVFFIRGFIVEPFRIPSNSMMPTLLTGDFVLVNKFKYGIRLPITNTKIFAVKDIERGDIVVFRYPNYEKNPQYSGADFIKRAIGLPGDKVSYINDVLTVNGKAIQYKNYKSYEGFKSGMKMDGYKHQQEILENNPHDILIDPFASSRSVELIVPKGHYFVMGDNRNNSSDSRFWGFVPEEYIIGNAFFIWMYFDSGFDFTRLGVLK